MLLLIQHTHRGDIHRGHHSISLDLIREETVEATCRAEIYSSVAGFISTIGQELFAYKSVMERKPLYALFGNIFHDATLSGEPQGTIVLDDAHDILTWHIEKHAFETAMGLVVGAQSSEGANPEFPLLVYQAAVHLVVRQCALVRSIFTTEIVEFSAFPIIAP